MAFDPYESWLGITAAHRPPTYYHLLGLSPFESDPATIEQAALRRMSKVRQYQIGPNGDVSQEILAELARARLVLIDPDRRADYDAKLRARAERPAIVEKEVIVDAVSSVAAPARDCLEILTKLRTGDESRAGASAAADLSFSGVALRSEGAGAGGDLHCLSSIAMQGSDGLDPVRSTKKKSRAILKNRLFLVAFVGTHIAIIAGFFAFGSAIALYVRSFFSATDSAARARRQGPESADGQPAGKGRGHNLVADNRSAPKTWRTFKRGTRITVAKSDDFDMSDHDFTIFVWFKTGNSGTLFSKAPATGGWGPGAKRLYIQGGRLAFEIHGRPSIVTGRQVNDEFWHDVAVTYTSQDHQFSLFIDGIHHGPQIVQTKKDVNGHAVRIGSIATESAANENEHFVGLISEVRFYQRALTMAEIDGLPLRDPLGKLPLARWKLSDADGQIAGDRTGHGHIGTLEDGAAALAGNEVEAVKPSDPSGLEKTRPAIGDPPPVREGSGGAQSVRIMVHEEVKADNSPEGILKKHGLKPKGQLYVHESEDEVQSKVTESLLLAGTKKYHSLKKQAAQNAGLRPQWIFQLELGIADNKERIKLIDQDMTGIQNHKFRGRFFNIEEEEYFNELTAFKARLLEELRQAEAFLNDLKSQPANLQWNQRDEESLNADQKAYEQSLVKIREFVDATNRKYHELRKNEEVRKALEGCGRNAKQPFKLGPSDKFTKNVGELEKIERAGKRGGKRRG